MTMMTAANDTTASRTAPLLQVDDLKVHFPAGRKGAFGPHRVVHAVDGVSFTVPRGGTFGIVGESGSGKSTTALAVMRLAPVSAGHIRLGDQPLSELSGAGLRAARRDVQMIFQDPFSSLNPRRRAAEAIREPLDRLGIGTTRERADRVVSLIDAVGLPQSAGGLFPHQFSGGQRQRICIARALASSPSLVVCDEAVSALDVAIQAQILNLLRRLQHELGLTYVFISHDLGVVQHICSEVAVMYLGRIVERAPTTSLFTRPRHPYTWSLMSAAAPAGPLRDALKRRFLVVGEPPSPIDPPPGCRFAGRCPFADDRCRTETPLERAMSPGHYVACHHAEKIDGPTI
ncbi:ABC transporter ATP-binding protein [Tistrella bauzanensis]|uniref:ABC transporter ATP-binding protein n=2 Tax=Tistrella bauzanensis TaxID=657419 RepID=A0ABQ1IM14_9PROT|nr:ABC transporter ATP-binding protein [Tistrella bauzanensis]